MAGASRAGAASAGAASAGAANTDGPAPLNCAGDAFILPPVEMARQLAELTRDGDIPADYYGVGGAVATFEGAIAQALGKEAAMVFPTGTMANLVGAELLCPARGDRLAVHRDSHMFNDAGESLQSRGLSVTPIDGDGPGFTAAALDAEIRRAAEARIRARVAAVAIESLSRRLYNRRFPDADRDAVVALAAERGLGTFLDGARLFVEAGFCGRTAAELAAPCDFVYVSLYKYLGAPFGAVLAGPAERLEGLFHQRRALGGSLFQMWPATVLAMAQLPRQQALWPRIAAHGRAVVAALVDETGREPPVVFADGTNVFLLPVAERFDEARFAPRGKALGLVLADHDGRRQAVVRINETWLAHEPAAIARTLIDAVS